MKSTRTTSLRFLLLFACLGLPGCLTPEQAIAEVNEEAYGVIADKEDMVLGRRTDFSVEPAKDRLIDRIRDPETGLVLPDQSVPTTLGDCLSLAAGNSREFQEQKEALFRAALALMRERETFRARPSGLFESAFTSSNQVRSLTGDADFGLTNMIKRGGNYALSVGLNALRIVSAPTNESLTSFVDLFISLPFLRNADRTVALENLTQADRDALYGVRDFERFKQTFAVDIISSYLRLLSQHQRVQNEEANVQSLTFAEKRNQAFFTEGRIAIFELDQAQQAKLRGENSLVVARQNLERALDSFKNALGLPVDVPLTVRTEDLAALEALMAKDPSLVERTLMLFALRSRLDFRTVVDGVTDAQRRLLLAEKQLEPELTLNLSGRATSANLKPLRYDFKDGTYSAAVAFDPGLDRDIESIALRSAVIDVVRSLRNQEALSEQIKFQVRNALRRLVQTRESFRIADQSAKLAQKRVDSTKALQEEGRASTRDFLESQEDLLSNQNARADALVEYRVAYLELLRDTGALVVTPGGIDHEATQALLESP